MGHCGRHRNQGLAMLQARDGPSANYIRQGCTLQRTRSPHRKSLVHCSMVSAGLVTLCPMVLGDEKIS